MRTPPLGLTAVLLAGTLLVTACDTLNGLLSPGSTLPGDGDNQATQNSSGPNANSSAGLVNNAMAALGSGMTDGLVARSGRLIGNNSAALIGNNSASLIGNNSASLIGNNSASLIGNNSASLIGNNSAALIGNNSASLIGNNSASYRIMALSSAYTDTGESVPLQIGMPYSGEITSSENGLDENYRYTHLVEALDLTGSGKQIATKFSRSEDVIKSKIRAVGHYAISGQFYKEANGSIQPATWVYRHEFTDPNTGRLNELVLHSHTALTGESQKVAVTDERLMGLTSRGALINLASTSSFDPDAKTLAFEQSGAMVAEGATFSITTRINGSVGDVIEAAGSLDLVSADQKFHLDIKQTGSQATFTPSLRSKGGTALASVTYLQSQGVFRAVYNDASQSVRYLAAGPILGLMNIANGTSGL